MYRFRVLTILFLSEFSPLLLNAQEDELKVGLRAGYNASFGGFAAISVETEQAFCKDFSVCGGMQYNNTVLNNETICKFKEVSAGSERDDCCMQCLQHRR